MKRKLVAAIFILCLLVGGVAVFNRCFSYVVNYNVGNAYFKKEFYATAKTYYEEALQKDVPEGKECSIRINLALAMLSDLGDDYAQTDNIEASIEILENAKDVLLEDDCATEDGSGHSETAEQLREEIQKAIENLKNRQESKEEKGESYEPKEENSKEEDIREQSIRQEIERMQEGANRDRQEEVQFMQEFDYEINFDYDGDIW